MTVKLKFLAFMSGSTQVTSKISFIQRRVWNLLAFQKTMEQTRILPHFAESTGEEPSGALCVILATLRKTLNQHCCRSFHPLHTALEHNGLSRAGAVEYTDCFSAEG